MKKHIFRACASAVAIATVGTVPSAAHAQEAMLGEIKMVGFNFCPRGYAALDGQLLAISSNQALFSLLGTMYGGDGRTTFGLPDMRGRFPMHRGNGPGLTPRTQGAKFGLENVTLTTNNLPNHTHSAAVQTANGQANTFEPRGSAFGIGLANDAYVSGVAPAGRFMHRDTVVLQPTGGSQSFNVMNPTQVVNFCIALQGIFPSRN